MPNVPRAYAGTPLLLPVSETGPEVPIGVLCVLGDEPRPLMTPDQRAILNDIATMITAEILNSWHQARREREQQMRTLVSTLLAQAVVQSSTVFHPLKGDPRLPSASEPEASPAQPSFPRHLPARELLPSSVLMAEAARQLRAILNADFACILDLSAFHLTWALQGSKTTSRFTWLGHHGRGASGEGKKDADGELIKVLGEDGSERCKEYCASRILGSASAMASVATFLEDYTQVRVIEFPPIQCKLTTVQVVRSLLLA